MLSKCNTKTWRSTETSTTSFYYYFSFSDLIHVIPFIRVNSRKTVPRLPLTAVVPAKHRNSSFGFSVENFRCKLPDDRLTVGIWRSVDAAKKESRVSRGEFIYMGKRVVVPIPSGSAIILHLFKCGLFGFVGISFPSTSVPCFSASRTNENCCVFANIKFAFTIPTN